MRVVLQHELRDVEGGERVPAQRRRVRADYRHYLYKHLQVDCMFVTYFLTKNCGWVADYLFIYLLFMDDLQLI